MMKFGTDRDFHSNSEIRLLGMERAIAQYQFSAQHRKEKFKGKIDEHTKLFIKGLGNEISFLSSFKELLFNSRELLEITLTKLNKMTSGSACRTSRNFLSFAKNMMKDDYDASGLETVKFLKTNITYVFHIRKARNEIKNNPANIEFLYNTKRFEAHFRVPINLDEKELIPYLDIQNKDEALKNMAYYCTYRLDEIFPEMLQFWHMCLAFLEKDVKALTT
jgi:hypothetical protein